MALAIYEDGEMSILGIPAAYSINGNGLVCRFMGEEILFSIEDNYLVQYEEETIIGYMVADDCYPSEDEIIIKEFDDGNKVLKHSTYFSKVN